MGPESAGVVPGPACYGKGGKKATVTEYICLSILCEKLILTTIGSANLVLGYLPSGLLGGTFQLDIAAARAAVQEVADALGLGLEEAAEGILRLANEKMLGALRNVSIERGHDPREYRSIRPD